MKKLFVILLFALSSSFFTICKAQYTILHSFFNGAIDGANPWGSLTLSGNKLYGMTTEGGTIHNNGCIFSIDTNGNNYKILLNFNDTNGSDPVYGSLIVSGGKLFGMTSIAGVNRYGNIFSINADGSGFKNLLYFNDTNGKTPYGSLIISEGRLFGMAAGGGAHDSGCIFSIDTDGTGYKKLFDFSNTNGAFPAGSLTLFGHILYGMTEKGGVDSDGVIFSIDTTGSNYKKLLDFNSIKGKFPFGSLTYNSGVLFGMTEEGGANDGGIIFSIDTNGSGYKDLFDLSEETGGGPLGSLTLSGNVLYGMTRFSMSFGGTIFSVNTNGSDFKDMNFHNPQPYGSLTYASGTLYGMTYNGGAENYGFVFKIDTNVTTGINNLTASKEGIGVYPNPNNGVFTVTLQNVNEPYQLEIYNVLGEKVYTEALLQNQSSNTISLTEQPAGVYFYRVLTQSGNFIGNGKLVIEK